MSDINEKTSIPLAWFVAAMSATLTVGMAGSFWVFSVNARLSRIEDKLGIGFPITEKQNFADPFWAAMNKGEKYGSDKY